jgi:hypothetical protein
MDHSVVAESFFELQASTVEHYHWSLNDNNNPNIYLCLSTSLLELVKNMDGYEKIVLISPSTLETYFITTWPRKQLQGCLKFEVPERFKETARKH